MQFPYVKDNPFRLLGLDTSALWSELAECASAAARRSVVGLPPEREALGSAELGSADNYDDLGHLVQGLFSDLELQTAYRWMWVPKVPSSVNPASLRALAQESKLQFPSSSSSRTLSMLCRWCEFAQSKDPQVLRSALGDLALMTRNSEHREFLKGLLVNEGLPESEAANCVTKAADRVVVALLQAASSDAVGFWTTGAIARAAALVHTISSADFSDQLVVRGMEPVVDYGDRVCLAVENGLPRLMRWVPTDPIAEPAKASELRVMAASLHARLPLVAASWHRAAGKAVSVLAAAVYEHATEHLQARNDVSGALALLQRLAELPLDREWSDRVNEDIGILQSIRPKGLFKMSGLTGCLVRRLLVWGAVALVAGIARMGCAPSHDTSLDTPAGETQTSTSTGPDELDYDVGSERAGDGLGVYDESGTHATDTYETWQSRRMRLEREHSELVAELMPVIQQAAEEYQELEKESEEIKIMRSLTDERDQDALRKLNARISRYNSRLRDLQRKLQPYEPKWKRLEAIEKALGM